MNGEDLARRWEQMEAAGLVGPGAIKPTPEGFDRIAARLAPIVALPVPPELASRIRRILAGAHRRRAEPGGKPS